MQLRRREGGRAPLLSVNIWGRGEEGKGLNNGRSHEISPCIVELPSGSGVTWAEAEACLKLHCLGDIERVIGGR